jgi:hypothetical protein
MASKSEPIDVGGFEDTRSLKEQMEAESIPWAPAKELDCPRAISGLVIENGETVTEYIDPETGEPRRVPTATVLDDERVEWSVIGFHTSLGNQMKEKGVVKGTRAGFRYLGSKDPADPKATQQYKVRVITNPAAVERVGGEVDRNGDVMPPPHGDDDIPY